MYSLKNSSVILSIFTTFRRSMSQGFFTRGLDVMDDLSDDSITPDQKKTYSETIQKFEQFTSQSLNGGGPKGIERHVKKNKKILVRDRIKLLIDPGSEFLELGSLAGFDMAYGDVPAGGMVSGIGKICGTYCMIGGNDATVKGGTYFPVTLKKSLRTQEIAQKNRLPTVYIPDSGGAYLPLQAEIFLQGGRSFYNQAVMSSKGVHQIAVVCGSCTAGGAYNPTMSDEAIIVQNVGKIYLGGPPLVKAATGEVVSDEDLGGAWMHSSVSGCTDYFASTEEEAFAMCREVVESLNMKTVHSHLPVNNFEEPSNSILSRIIGKEHFSKTEVYSIIASIVDGSKFKEFKSMFGPGMIVGTGYIQGLMVGIIANTDEILSPEALKASHFVNMSNNRQIPLLFLQNSLPLSVSQSSEIDQVVLKDRGKMCCAISNVTVPKVSLTISACHEDDALLMCGPSFSPNLSLIWPSSKFSCMSMETHDNNVQGGTFDAFYAAFNMLTDTVILPQSTRPVMGEILRLLAQQTINPEICGLSSPVFRM